MNKRSAAMTGLISIIFQSIRAPNLPYTILLGLMMFYWLSVIIGVFNLKSLDLDSDAEVDLDTDMDLDADAEADIDTDADMEAETEMETDADVQAEGHESFLYHLSALLNLGKVPFSIWLSIFIPLSWALSLIFNGIIDLAVPFAIHSFFRLITGFFLIIPFAGLITRAAVVPLHPFFKMKETTSNIDFVNDFCLVTSSKVTPTFGIAEITKEGMPIILNIRSDEKEMLKKGDKALILKYDKKKNIYFVKKFAYESMLSKLTEE